MADLQRALWTVELPGKQLHCQVEQPRAYILFLRLCKDELGQQDKQTKFIIILGVIGYRFTAMLARRFFGVFLASTIGKY